MKKKEKKTKIKRDKKPIPKDIKIYIESFVIIALLLGVTLPIHYCVKGFTWFWTIFAWILVLVPVGLINSKTYVESQNSYTEAQKKSASGKIGIMILWYWYLDLVYMTIFNGWTIAMYVTSTIALVILFHSLTVNFLNRNIKNSFMDKSLILDLLLGLGLTSYLIYTISDEKLQTIITAVVAALFGGLLTLVGVAWTIKDANQSKKIEEIKKAEPLFAFNMLRSAPSLSSTVERVCFPIKLEQEHCCEVYSQIENSNKNSFTLKRVYHDGEWTELEGNVVVLPSSKCILAFNFSNYPTNIFIEVEDELSNKHYYQLLVLFLGAKTETGKAQHTIRGIVKTDISKISKGE